MTLNRPDWPELHSVTFRISRRCVLTVSSFFVSLALFQKKAFRTEKMSSVVFSVSLLDYSTIYYVRLLSRFPSRCPTLRAKKRVTFFIRREQNNGSSFTAVFRAKYIDICFPWHCVKGEERSLLIKSLIRYCNWHPTGLLLSADRRDISRVKESWGLLSFWMLITARHI